MIRLATPDDGPSLMAMGAQFHDEAGYGAMFPFDAVSFAHTVAALGPRGLVLVGEINGQIVGMAAADVAPVITNHNALMAREAFWYVLPLHRKGIGRALLNALVSVATDHGAIMFDTIAEEGRRSEALARLYRAAGFSPAERTFRKVLVQGTEEWQSQASSAA
jgi:GNAT superfamily N-acetyltransferase